MRISKFLAKTQKEKTPFDDTTDRLIRGNFAIQESAGIFQYLPLGTKVMINLENLVRKYFDRAMLQEVRLPILQDLHLWKESGRENSYGAEMFRLENRDGKRFCLAPTAEECIVFMIKAIVASYTFLPIIAYQMLNKYRDELRPRFGLIRNKEFVMMDAYSFDASSVKAEESYIKMYKLYIEIFKALKLSFVFASADTGEVGGSFSQNVFVRSNIGEDTLKLTVPWDEYEAYCMKVETYEQALNLSMFISDEGTYEYKVVEVGHIFNLGEKYSSSMSAKYHAESGSFENYHMGCYGIGMSRLMQVILENHKDLPEVIAPYKIHLIGIDAATADRVYESIPNKHMILFDDRKYAPGQKFADADLIGIPHRIIIGKHLEYTNKSDESKNKLFDNIEDLIEFINDICL